MISRQLENVEILNIMALLIGIYTIILLKVHFSWNRARSGHGSLRAPYATEQDSVLNISDVWCSNKLKFDG